MSKVNIWLPIFVGDFTVETQGLTHEELGIYMRLLLQLWAQDGSLRNDDSYLARLLGISVKKWLGFKKNIIRLFNASESGMLSIDWVTRELVKAKKNREQKRLAANKRWGNKKSESMHVHCSSNTNALHGEMHVQCPSPSPLPGTVSCLNTGDQTEQKNQKNVQKVDSLKRFVEELS